MTSDGRLDVDQLLTGPLACAVLLLAKTHELTPAQLADPITTLLFVTAARDALDPHSGHQRDLVDLVLEHGGRLRDYAAAVAADEQTRWWSEPAPASPQMLLGPAPLSFHPTPTAPVETSTMVGETSSMQVLREHQVGDWDPPYPLRRTTVVPTGEVSVFEVTSAQDWHALVTDHPVVQRSGHDSRPTLYGTTVEQPDWGAVAEHHHAVHLSLLGLLTAWCVPITGAGVTTLLWTWDGERTRWLSAPLHPVAALPPVTGGATGRLPRLPEDYLPGQYLRPARKR